LHLILLSRLIFDSVHTNFDTRSNIEWIKPEETKMLAPFSR
jgi:hypothetical protein